MSPYKATSCSLFLAFAGQNEVKSGINPRVSPVPRPGKKLLERVRDAIRRAANNFRPVGKASLPTGSRSLPVAGFFLPVDDHSLPAGNGSLPAGNGRYRSRMLLYQEGIVLYQEGNVLDQRKMGADRKRAATWQLRFKFDKAYGKIDGVNLYGRKSGTSSWTPLGRFNATPANTIVPLADSSPEEWQFQSRAVRRDQEIGNPSPVMTAIIRS